MMGESEANISQSKEEKTAEETKAIIQEPESEQDAGCTTEMNSGDDSKKEELSQENIEGHDKKKKKAMREEEEQENVFGLQAGFLGVLALFATIVSDIFSFCQYTDIACGLVVACFVFFSLSKTFHKWIRRFIKVEGASDAINTMTVLATIYFCAGKFMDVSSCELRIVAIIFIVFCIWLLFYVFYYKRHEHKEEKTTRISIETDKNVDIHITEKQDPDGDDE